MWNGSVAARRARQPEESRMPFPPSLSSTADPKLWTQLTEATKAQAAATLAAAMIGVRGTREDSEAIAIYHMFYSALFSSDPKAGR
jgi:hypothetical protein